MVEKEGYIFVFGLDKDGSDRELDAYYELYVECTNMFIHVDGWMRRPRPALSAVCARVTGASL